MSKKPDNYYRVLFHRVRDAKLITWLEKDRRVGERPGAAIRRKLYGLLEKGE